MLESGASFDSLPTEYQQVIQLAQERHNIAITPLQVLVGGWSGAFIYLVRVASIDTERVEHLVLKLDRKRPMATSDEVSRHRSASEKSPEDFADQHIPNMMYEYVEYGNAQAIFYAIAGQSLHKFRTLSSHRQQDQLERLFTATTKYLLEGWNAGLRFEHIDHPQTLLVRWLGFRLDPGQKIEKFLTETCGLDPDYPGLIIQGKLFPNPLHYARNLEAWGSVRSGDAVVGLQHGDLNTNNILAKFSDQGDGLDGYYLIDFALFKENMPLLYDPRYLEMSYLVHAIEGGSYTGAINLITQLADHEILETRQAPIEMTGINAALRAGRIAFRDWVTDNHPSLHDDLWGQYWLGGSAAGLSYCHKAGQPDEVRLAGLIYAASNLKQYFKLFGLSMPARASQLQIANLRSTSSRTRVASPGPPLHNLPTAPTKFIGRESEVADISDLLLQPDTRLVTLTGPGGTGKTRLGLELGQAVMDQFSHGVFFVDLAPIRDPELIATTTAHAMGIREGGGRPPLENLKDYLANKKMLLIFDNFEQITEAADFVWDLLAAGPGLKTLVTSRIPLQLRGEHEYPVSPLGLPPDAHLSIDESLQYEAVMLFRQQACSVSPHFEITKVNQAAVVEICRRLDGLPLAIEIAAARIKMLPPKALLKRLDQSLKLLVSGAKDLPDRQRTLRGTIDWSYQLLELDEQRLFNRLGIFPGGFSLEAIEGICNPEGDLEIFSAVERLLNNSLLRRVPSVTDEARFDMLQTIRDFALEKVVSDGDLTELSWAHCRYFAQLATELNVVGFSADSGTWLRRLEEEHDNYRAALSWAMDHEEGGPEAFIMLGQLPWFWYRHGHLQEGSEWTERALRITEKFGVSPMRTMALTSRAYLALWTGDLIKANLLSSEAVQMAEQLKFDDGLAMAKLNYGTTLINQGKDKEAYPHLVDAVELYDQQNQPWMKGTTLVHLANVSLGFGDPAQAIKWLDMAMPYMQEAGDTWSIAFALNNYGEVARSLGDYEKAEGYYRRTEELYEQADAKGDQARLINIFGYITQHKGDFAEAEALFRESLDDFRELGNHRGIAECLAGLAGLAAELGHHQWAAPLLGAAEAQLNTIGGAWWPADRVEIDRAIERMQAALGNEFTLLREQGQRMSVEEAVAYATKVE